MWVGTVRGRVTGWPDVRRPSRSRLLLPFGMAALTAAVLGACAGPRVPDTPQPATGVFRQLVLHGGATPSLVSGDTGCGNPDLTPFAIHAQVHVPASAASSFDVYLFTYADRAAYDRQASAFEACRTAFAASAAAAGRPVDELDISPYRAFGAGWTPELRAALLQSMQEAAGNGG